MIILKLDDGNQCELVQTYSAESASPQLRALKPPRYRSAPTCWSPRLVRTLKNSHPLFSSNVCFEAARAIFKMRTNVKVPKRSNKIRAMSLRQLLGRLSAVWVNIHFYPSYRSVDGSLYHDSFPAQKQEVPLRDPPMDQPSPGTLV